MGGAVSDLWMVPSAGLVTPESVFGHAGPVVAGCLGWIGVRAWDQAALTTSRKASPWRAA